MTGIKNVKNVFYIYAFGGQKIKGDAENFDTKGRKTREWSSDFVQLPYQRTASC